MLDYESRFRAEVMESFADSYARGETPVPCIACNRTVKFRDLLRTARELGAEALATGHYVQRLIGEAGPELHRGADPARDQSYFLFGTTREQLDFLRFPLGALPKSETRALAERFDLAVADKPDSQDICFVPNGDYAAVVQKLRPEAVEAGDIVDMAGRVVGRHDGIVRFTVGQRRGLALGSREGTDNDPLYVVRLEPETRRVVVGPRSALGRSEIALYDVNWIGPALEGVLPVQVRVRSSQALRPPRSSAPARVRSCASPSPRSASRPARPAWSTTPRTAAACWAEASSGASRHDEVRPSQPAGQQSRPLARLVRLHARPEGRVRDRRQPHRGAAGRRGLRDLPAGKAGRAPNGTALWFQVDDVDAIFAEWTARGVAFAHGPQKNFWGYGPELADPDGYIVRLWDERTMREK